MNAKESPSDRRAVGPLIAFIDLLFLLVAFFVLMLFYLHEQKTVTEAALEQTQQQLETVQAAKSTTERVLEELQPFMGKISALQKAEQEKRRAEEARQLRRRQKEALRLEYEVLPSGAILYAGKTLPVDKFAAEIVEPAREQHWIAFRAFARPETPFGLVVQSRRALLEHQQEFDTYWDNLPDRPTRQ